jgi:hypothetical protein
MTTFKSSQVARHIRRADSEAQAFLARYLAGGSPVAALIHDGWSRSVVIKISYYLVLLSMFRPCFPRKLENTTLVKE